MFQHVWKGRTGSVPTHPTRRKTPNSLVTNELEVTNRLGPMGTSRSVGHPGQREVASPAECLGVGSFWGPNQLQS